MSNAVNANWATWDPHGKSTEVSKWFPAMSTADSYAPLPSSSRMVLNPPIVLGWGNQKLSIAVAEPDENETLSRLSPIQRWMYIAKNHPVEFSISVAGVFIAIWILITYAPVVFHSLSFSFVSSAFAQGPADTPKFSGSDIRMCAFLVMAVALLWSMAVATLAKSAARIAWAKENAKFVLGFVGGIAAGTAPK